MAQSPKFDNEFVERDVLSGLFNIEGAMGRALDYSLCEEDFLAPEHQMLFKYVLSFYLKLYSVPDKRTIMENIGINNEEKKVEFGYYLENKIIGQKDIPLQRFILKVEELKNLTLLRTMMVATHDVFADIKSQKKTAMQSADTLISKITEVLNRTRPTDKMILNEGFQRFFEDVRKRESGEKTVAYSTGFRDLDKMVRIFPGLTYIVGRPGSGKSLLVLSMAFNLAVYHDVPSVVISAEMKNLENMKRLIAAYTKIPAQTIAGMKGNMTEEEKDVVKKAYEKIGHKNMHFAYNPNFDVNELKSTIMWYHKTVGVKVFFLDYFQLFKGDSTRKGFVDKHTEYTDISEAMRVLAEEKEIPIVAAAQAKAEVENRKNPRVRLNDIAYTDKAAKDAMTVLGLYNDEWYNKENAEKKGILEIGVLKARTGEGWKTVDLRFDARTQSLMDYDFNNDFEEKETSTFGLNVATEEELEEFDLSCAEEENGE